MTDRAEPRSAYSDSRPISSQNRSQTRLSSRRRPRSPLSQRQWAHGRTALPPAFGASIINSLRVSKTMAKFRKKTTTRIKKFPPFYFSAGLSSRIREFPSNRSGNQERLALVHRRSRQTECRGKKVAFFTLNSGICRNCLAPPRQISTMRLLRGAFLRVESFVMAQIWGSVSGGRVFESTLWVYRKMGGNIFCGSLRM